MSDKKMICKSVRFPEAIIEDIDTFIEKDLYPNRAEFIRIAVRNLIQTEFMILSIKEKEIGEVIDNSG